MDIFVFTLYHDKHLHNPQIEAVNKDVVRGHICYVSQSSGVHLWHNYTLKKQTKLT